MQPGLFPTHAVQGGLCTGFALGWLFPAAHLHSHKMRLLQQKIVRFAVGLTHAGTSSYGLTPASPPSLCLQHSSMEAPAQQPGTCQVLRGALDAVSFPVDALSGAGPAKHFVLPSTRRQTPTIDSGLSLQTMTQEVLRAHRTSQAVFESKQWSHLPLPT